MVLAKISPTEPSQPTAATYYIKPHCTSADQVLAFSEFEFVFHVREALAGILKFPEGRLNSLVDGTDTLHRTLASRRARVQDEAAMESLMPGWVSASQSTVPPCMLLER